MLWFFFNESTPKKYKISYKMKIIYPILSTFFCPSCVYGMCVYVVLLCGLLSHGHPLIQYFCLWMLVVFSLVLLFAIAVVLLLAVHWLVSIFPIRLVNAKTNIRITMMKYKLKGHSISSIYLPTFFFIVYGHFKILYILSNPKVK